MFWVEWVGADATGRNNSRGGFCLRAPPSNHGHLLSTIEGYRPLYLPVVTLAPRWEGGMVGVRNERQTHLPSPPVWTAPLRSSLYRRPPAESSHGSYERSSGFLQKLGILWNITTISILWVTTQTQLFLILITPKKNFPEQGSGLSSSLGRILGYPTGYSQHNTPNKW